jgi:hypothetical protein
VGAVTALAVLLGGVAVVVAWIGAAASADVEEQVPWGVVGVAGTGLICLTSAVWLGAARLAVVRRRLRVTRLLATRVPQPAVPMGLVEGSRADVVVAAPAMTHFHRDGCRLVAGKDVRRATRAAHERDGRTPCGVCRP